MVRTTSIRAEHNIDPKKYIVELLGLMPGKEEVGGYAFIIPGEDIARCVTISNENRNQLAEYWCEWVNKDDTDEYSSIQISVERLIGDDEVLNLMDPDKLNEHAQDLATYLENHCMVDGYLPVVGVCRNNAYCVLCKKVWEPVKSRMIRG